MSQEQRLKDWIDGLDPDTIKKITLECVSELILTESVNFYESSKAPYWDATGERLDGSEESVYEDDDEE